MLESALYIFFLRLADISAGTIRVLFVMRGRKLPAWILGFIQSLVFVIAIRAVLSDLDNWVNILGYAGGFATGTVLGIWVEERLALGHSHVRIISSRHGAQLAEMLRETGFGVTEVAGRGRDGTVDILNCDVHRRQLNELKSLVAQIDPDAFMTVENVRPLWRGFWR